MHSTDTQALVKMTGEEPNKLRHKAMGHSPARADRAYVKAAIDEMIWNLGRSLLLIWLHRVRSIEPFFITTPIRSCKLLARDFLRAAARYGIVLVEDRKAVAETCSALMRDHYLGDDELFDRGLTVLDMAGWDSRFATQRHARYMHLRAFVLRARGDEAQYRRQMRIFVEISARLREERHDRYTRAEYRSRRLYEEASAALFQGTRADLEKAVRLLGEALDSAARLERGSEPESVQHLLFGARRMRLMCRLLQEKDHEGLREWSELNRCFPREMEHHLPHDSALLCEVRRAGERNPRWRGELVRVSKSVSRALGDHELSSAAQVFLRRELAGLRRIRRQELSVRRGQGHLPYEGETPERHGWLARNSYEPVVIVALEEARRRQVLGGNRNRL